MRIFAATWAPSRRAGSNRHASTALSTVAAKVVSPEITSADVTSPVFETRTSTMNAGARAVPGGASGVGVSTALGGWISGAASAGHAEWRRSAAARTKASRFTRQQLAKRAHQEHSSSPLYVDAQSIGNVLGETGLGVLVVERHPVDGRITSSLALPVAGEGRLDARLRGEQLAVAPGPGPAVERVPAREPALEPAACRPSLQIPPGAVAR